MKSAALFTDYGWLRASGFLVSDDRREPYCFVKISASRIGEGKRYHYEGTFISMRSLRLDCGLRQEPVSQRNQAGLMPRNLSSTLRGAIKRFGSPSRWPSSFMFRRAS